MLKLVTGVLLFSLTTSAFAGMFGNRHRSHFSAPKAVEVVKPAPVVAAKPAVDEKKSRGGIFHKRRHHFGGFRGQASK